MRTSHAIALALLLGACERPEPADPAQPEAAAPPSPIEARVRVHVEPARAEPLRASLELTGVVEPQAQVLIKAETAGRVLVREVERGERVEEGQLLYSLDGSRARIEYQRAQAQQQARETDLAQAERDRERNASLHARSSVAAATLERSVHQNDSAAAATELARIGKRAAARSLRDAKLRAPFAGVVAEYHVERGDYLGPGSPVLTLVDLSRVRLRVGLTAAELELVHPGQRLAVSFDELGGARFEGELMSVSPLADPRSGTYTAELWLDNEGERLRQGMLGRVELELSGQGEQVEHDAPLSIPRRAVMRRHGRYAVWILDPSTSDPQRVLPRELLLGRAQGDRVVVLAGLEPGDQVVHEGMFALREGAAVEVEGSAP